MSDVAIFMGDLNWGLFGFSFFVEPKQFLDGVEPVVNENGEGGDSVDSIVVVYDFI